ncbi:MAG: hypothetical protein UV74_C0013G0318 [Candidatus Woesebacteria bacterium GW2011_GWB1_43_14]|uniref:Bacterial membrane protein YfhO n=1 Tax=Candidatus Woesebacteria bacterium GW2011_GWB1_43_14 TaxID=1618578 RepID=A0A0G1FQ96_9BACT|nr:MAG: hypothetical protein UT21_C0001G0028 [Candidatus Woesebacteria bacterium GW2011_GWA1_39_11b]KKS78387.1 MAG: hypothetical protein UV51_C0001G0103 [Candidatus Woesebacteria bacterium GW2011_GWC1_42_9]KKS97196.1 MAG: hypothetical protein UV74_C0013G0318 [Candidatus Woesebacteria bacterium GW2011_GWB1_43_14]
MKKLTNKFLRSWTSIAGLILGSTPVIWFLGRPGILINGSDTNFPLDPLKWFIRRFYVWHSVSSAGSDFSSSLAGIFFHLVQVVPFILGFNLQTVQIISLVFWFMLITFCSYLFANSLFPRSKLAQIVFIVFYAFNIYLFNTWENVKVANLALVAAIPFGGWILTRLKDGSLGLVNASFWSIVLGIMLSGSGINPAYFLTFLIIIFILFVSEIVCGISRKRLFDYFIVVFFVTLVNMFWILPTLRYILVSVSVTHSIDSISYTNWIDSLSQNTSLFNVFRLQGAWDWYAQDSATGTPLYIPYSVNYFRRLPFVSFSLLIPFLVFLSLLVRSKRRTNGHFYLGFAIMVVLGVFLGTGTHLPTGLVFRFFSERLPFFSLFRSPWYIFTPLLIFSYAGLLGLLISTIQKRTAIVFSMTVILVVGNFFYNYPLVTGKIFRPAMKDNFLVKFPEYVWETKDWLDTEDQIKGRIIGYPDDEIERFKWGYGAVDSLLNLFSDREILFPSLNAPDSNLSLVLKEFYISLKKQKLTSAQNIARILNVGMIFDKRDQISLAPLLPEKITGSPVARLGEWSFYQFPQKDRYLSKIYASQLLFLGYPTDREAVLSLGSFDGESILVNSKDSEVIKISDLERISGRIVSSINSQEKIFRDFQEKEHTLFDRFTHQDLSRVNFSFEVPNDGVYQPVIENYRLGDFGLDFDEEFKIQINGQEQTWQPVRSTDSLIYFAGVELAQGKYEVAIELENKDLVNEDFEGEMKFEREGSESQFVIRNEDTRRFLEIVSSKDADTSAGFVISSFDPLIPYYLSVDYKKIYGENAAIIAVQGRGHTLVKSQLERMPLYSGWKTYGFFYDPVKTESQMKVLLVASRIEDVFGTTVYYDNLSVYRVFTNRLFLVNEKNTILSAPQVYLEDQSPVSYKGTVKGVMGPHILVFSENYSPAWEIKIINSNGRKIDVRPLHFSANLYANAWYLENLPDEYYFEIYYKPQRLFKLGFIILVSSLTISLTFLLGNRLMRK